MKQCSPKTTEIPQTIPPTTIFENLSYVTRSTFYLYNIIWNVPVFAVNYKKEPVLTITTNMLFVLFFLNTFNFCSNKKSSLLVHLRVDLVVAARLGLIVTVEGAKSLSMMVLPGA